MMREFKVDANVGRPQVAYRETVRQPVEKIEGRFVRQTGGRGQYGHAVINLEPAPGEGFDFVNKIKGGVDPLRVHPGRRAGNRGGARDRRQGRLPDGGRARDARRRVLPRRRLLGDGVQDRRARWRFREAARRAKPVLLEPIMAVEVVTPEEFMGDVIGDLNRRRGRIEGMEPRGNAQVIRAYVPLAEMFGYATDLRSADAGPGDLHDAVRPLQRGALGAVRGDHRAPQRHPRGRSA